MSAKPDPDIDQFRIHHGQRVAMSELPTLVAPLYESKAEYKRMLANQVREMARLQYKLYASNSYALLIIFQAMDAAGKDGAIRHVMSGVNPQGTQVHSFKHPSENELDHDFLWRVNQALPERGGIGIFNRSYYEEVLIVRVHPKLLDAERIPDHLAKEPDVWENRFESIRDQERHLHRNGTRIIKFFLHISKEEQRKRFLSRIDKPNKNWKFSLQDVEERQYWDDYMHAYEECLSATSTHESPWYAIPADDKKNARLLVAHVISKTLESMDLKIPELPEERLDELQVARERLLNEN